MYKLILIGCVLFVNVKMYGQRTTCHSKAKNDSITSKKNNKVIDSIFSKDLDHYTINLLGDSNQIKIKKYIDSLNYLKNTQPIPSFVFDNELDIRFTSYLDGIHYRKSIRKLILDSVTNINSLKRLTKIPDVKIKAGSKSRNQKNNIYTGGSFIEYSDLSFRQLAKIRLKQLVL